MFEPYTAGNENWDQDDSNIETGFTNCQGEHVIAEDCSPLQGHHSKAEDPMAGQLYRAIAPRPHPDVSRVV